MRNYCWTFQTASEFSKLAKKKKLYFSLLYYLFSTSTNSVKLSHCRLRKIIKRATNSCNHQNSVSLSIISGTRDARLSGVYTRHKISFIPSGCVQIKSRLVMTTLFIWKLCNKHYSALHSSSLTEKIQLWIILGSAMCTLQSILQAHINLLPFFRRLLFSFKFKYTPEVIIKKCWNCYIEGAIIICNFRPFCWLCYVIHHNDRFRLI
jgi:hypothetical protein